MRLPRIDVKTACSRRMSLRFRLLHQPLKGLDDSARFNPQRHMDPAVRLVAMAASAGHADSKILVPLQPFAALLVEALRVPAGKVLRVGKTVLALIGLGEDEGDGAHRPADLFVRGKLAEVADELHRVKVFVGLTALDARSIDEDEHTGALTQKPADHRVG